MPKLQPTDTSCPSVISYGTLRKTLKSLETYTKKKKLKGFETMTVLSLHITRYTSTIKKSIPQHSLVVVTRQLSTGGKGGTTALLKDWKLPGYARDREGRGGKSIYESSRPVDVTNGVKDMQKKILKTPLNGPSPGVLRAPLLANPFVVVDANIPDEKKVLINKFLREGKTGETVTTFYERLKKQDDSADEHEDDAASDATTDPFVVGATIGGATKSGGVKKGKITKLHSQVYVYVRWDEDMWNKKVNKAKLSILQAPPKKKPKPKTPTPPLDSSSDESDDGLNTMSGQTQDTENPKPFPSSTEFWSDTTAFASATRLTANLREKRKNSTRKVTRSDLAREAKDGTPAKKVDFHKHANNKKRMKVSFKEKDDIEDNDDDDDESQTFAFPENDDLEEDSNEAPSPGPEITRRSRGGRIFLPALPGSSSKHRSSRSRLRPSTSTSASAFTSPDPNPEPQAPPRIERNLSPNQGQTSSDGSALLASKGLGTGFSEAVLSPGKFGSPSNKRKKATKYGKRGAARITGSRLTASALARHTKKSAVFQSDADDKSEDEEASEKQLEGLKRFEEQEEVEEKEEGEEVVKTHEVVSPPDTQVKSLVVEEEEEGEGKNVEENVEENIEKNIEENIEENVADVEMPDVNVNSSQPETQQENVVDVEMPDANVNEVEEEEQTPITQIAPTPSATATATAIATDHSSHSSDLVTPQPKPKPQQPSQLSQQSQGLFNLNGTDYDTDDDDKTVAKAIFSQVSRGAKRRGCGARA
ncbi:hypothetical protein TrLO_g7598 [Triparma laevis f. longispina]|uniref:Uncharacterized protein n=1 Tax=Triparma laevis f. longispina TaxID=1714387 RepID=A0A9W7FAM5_9STRA|nr:hypothetical protein TrLO_g7598 [Triparma laevis f. longispina]